MTTGNYLDGTHISSEAVYKNDDKAAASPWEFCHCKKLHQGPPTPKVLGRKITLFEEIGSLGVKSGWGHKPITSQIIEDATTAVLDESMTNVAGSTSARAMSRRWDASYRTVWKVLKKVVHCYPYKISHNYQLFATDRETQLSFALTFLARMQVDVSWPRQILWSIKEYFHLCGTVNTSNCHIWDTANSCFPANSTTQAESYSLVRIYSHIYP